ncbi:MAG: ornithine cyclodeaminase family protein [Salinirussus sp.]
MTDAVFLTSEDVDGLATPAEYIDAVRAGYRQRGEGAPAKPRQALDREEPEGHLTSYLAILPETGAMGGYMYTAGFADSDGWFLTPIFDPETGAPIALVDGASMNPFKTGAAGAVAVDELAREDASDVAIIGSGAQARGQLHATAAVRELERVRVFSPTAANRAAFAESFDQQLDADVAAVDSSSTAVSGADIVITATTAGDPVVSDADIDPGTHVTAMGQYTPGRHEIEVSTVARSIYVPDLRERVMQDAGAFLAALDAGAIEEDHIHAELGDIVAGTAPGRTDADDVTVFDSGGTGIETVAAAHLLVEKARDAGLGTDLPIAPASTALTGRLE